ncbi:hydroxymethylpyrimidine/phosphomethylpyrimidine kinase [Thermodesulfobacterium sp. TA1]|uniref:hydroxymethylpyrimidine/phosphomethylpyrimidine kinase n=1 Tax=Thermodesulfobacterium sp. TA1 TaxID=2234087 RepID=UPI001232360D|nr:hydroxymethylpyrimidine/phosphomethylpyrimidine kinase [Thermodesulfobacterium sp. TA1]QER41837.1 hydroxymethylpyrimidine/phosphomethylpyrimidine kinase [Thermodesulfobacterium sp. TA1]
MFVLSLAGFDPSGGAGILMDIKVFSLLGLKGGGIPTTLTLQNTSVFEGWTPVDVNYFERALKLVFSDLPVKGIKIGMIGSCEILEVLLFYLKKYHSEGLAIVYDPVLKATLNHPLFSSEEFLPLVKKNLLPLLDFITPNLYEASLLTQTELKNLKDLEKAGKTLLGYGCKQVIITGYQKKDKIYDCFFSAEKKAFLGKKKLAFEFHGTGCAFSSSLLGFLVKGASPFFAFKKAKNWLYLYLKKGTVNPLGGKLCLFL